MFVCICKGVTDRDIVAVAEQGATRMSELKECTGLASQCGKCARDAKTIFNDAKRQARQMEGMFSAA
ncbi:MAG: bacterioferritin-associated ferredoxin [Marinomonas primoryensis]|jgi:bacterioferritin-associated ferredoxin